MTEPTRTHQPSDASLLSTLTTRVDELLAVVERQGRCIEELTKLVDKDRRAPSPASPLGQARRGDDDGVQTDEYTALADRRHLLRQAGAAAVGLVAGGAVLASSAEPAAAANGGNLVIGAANDGTVTTRLAGSQFRVDDGNGTISISGTHIGDGAAGVDGYTTGSGSTAVSGRGVGPLSYGVLGGGTSIGVAGYTFGASPLSRGVEGSSVEGSGVVGVSTNGAAVVADSTFGPALRLTEGSTAMPPTVGTWRAGDVSRWLGHLWYCTLGGVGAASRWVRLSGAFVARTPLRIYDTRPGQDPIAVGPKTPFVSTEIRVIDAGFGEAVPAGATAALVNLTATNTNPGGFFSAWQNGVAYPGTSNLNWGLPNSTVANQAVVALDSNRLFQVRMEGEGGADLVIDVVGHYA